MSQEVYLYVVGEPRYSPRRGTTKVTFGIHGAERLPNDALRGVDGAKLTYGGSSADRVHQYTLVVDGGGQRCAAVQDILIAVAKGNDAARTTLVEGLRHSDDVRKRTGN